jgi:hypothetical protein
MTTNIQSFAGDVQIDSGNLSVKSLEVKDGVTKLGSNNTSYSNVGVMMTRKDGASNVAFLFTEDGANVVLGYTNDDALEGDSIDILSDEKANLVVYGNVYVSGSVHGDGSTLTGLVTTLQSVSEFGAETDQTILFTNEITGINVSSNVLVSGNVTANVYYGDGGLLANITQTLEGITAIGNTTPYTLEFNNTDTSFVTVSNVGIGNALPTADLCVGSNVVIDDERLNKINVTGNVACDQLNLGSIEILPAYSLEQVTGIGNTTTNTMSFNNSTLAFDTLKMAGIGIIPSSADVGVSGLHVDGHLRLGGEAENTNEEQMYIKAAGALGVLANESDTNNTNTELRLQTGDTYNSNITMVGKSSAQYMTFGTNTAERMRIDSSGRVGIGTTDPYTNLHIKRSDAASGTITADDYYLLLGQNENGVGKEWRIGFGYNVSTTNVPPAYIGYHEESNDSSTYGDLVFGARTNGTGSTQATEHMRITHDGKVGIATDDPGTALDVVGVGRFTQNGANIQLVGTDHTYLEYYPDGISNGRKAYVGYSNADDNNFTISNSAGNGHINLETGNVGIGTNNPTSNLYVSGNTYITSNLTVGTANLHVDTTTGFVGVGTTNPLSTVDISSTTGLILRNTANKTAVDDRVGYIEFYNGSTVNGNMSSAIEACVNVDGANNNTDLRFKTTFDYNNYLVERMRIDRAGNVGIGTNAPQAKLDTRGDAIFDTGKDDTTLTGLFNYSSTQDVINAGIGGGTGSIAASTDINPPPGVAGDVIAKFVNSGGGEILTNTFSLSPMSMSVNDVFYIGLWVYATQNTQIQYFKTSNTYESQSFNVAGNSKWTWYESSFVVAYASAAMRMRLDNNTGGTTYYFTGFTIRKNPSQTTGLPFTPKYSPASGRGAVLSTQTLVAQDVAFNGEAKISGLTYGLKLSGTLYSDRTSDWYRLLVGGIRDGLSGVRTSSKLLLRATGLHQVVTFDFNHMISIPDSSGNIFNLYANDHFLQRNGITKLRVATTSDAKVALDMFIDHDVVATDRDWTIELYVDGGSLISAPTTFLEKITSAPTNAIELDITTAIFAVQDSDETTPLCINEDGNVGIGTTNPAKRLTVSGDMEIGIQSADYRHLRIGGGNSSGFLYGCFAKYGDGIHMGYNFYNDNTNNQIPNNSGGTSRITMKYGEILLHTGGTNSEPNNDALTINSSGNIGIGTYSAPTPLALYRSIGNAGPSGTLNGTITETEYMRFIGAGLTTEVNSVSIGFKIAGDYLENAVYSGRLNIYANDYTDDGNDYGAVPNKRIASIGAESAYFAEGESLRHRTRELSTMRKDWMQHEWGQPGTTADAATSFYYSTTPSNVGSTDHRDIRTSSDPYGRSCSVWRNTGVDNNGACGGWDVKFPINANRSYMSVVYVRRTGSTTGGNFYHGCDGEYTKNLTGTDNTNPYFTGGYSVGALPQDVWCVSISFIHYYGATSSDATGIAGIYRLDTMQKIKANSEFAHRYEYSSTTERYQRHRTFLFYNPNTGVKLDFWNPGFFEHQTTFPETSLLKMLTNDLVATNGYFHDKLGIGVTGPSYNLHVANHAKIGNMTTLSGAGSVVDLVSTNIDTSISLIGGSGGGTIVLYISVNTSGGDATGSAIVHFRMIHSGTWTDSATRKNVISNLNMTLPTFSDDGSGYLRMTTSVGGNYEYSAHIQNT